MTHATMTETPEIRRHADGSINTNHYMQIGRQQRSEALYSGCRAIACFGGVVISKKQTTTHATMTETPETRRHADGSINTKHYMQIGHQQRSEALYSGCRAIACFGGVVTSAVKRLWSLSAIQRPDTVFAKI